MAAWIQRGVRPADPGAVPGRFVPPLPRFIPTLPPCSTFICLTCLVFVLVALPLILLDFTMAYFLWMLLNLVVLLLYLLHFVRAIGERANLLRVSQWMLCVALISNLFLGQMNVPLVIFLGEFLLAFMQGRRTLSGFWLGGMLMKPHTLVLLLGLSPGDLVDSETFPR